MLKHHKFLMISTLLLGAVGLQNSAEARELPFVSAYNIKAEIACEKALKEDTAEALRAYKLKYFFARTACNTLARNASPFTSDGDGAPPGGPGDPPGGPGDPPADPGGKHPNNGRGNGDQDAPGKSGDHNNADH